MNRTPRLLATLAILLAGPTVFAQENCPAELFFAPAADPANSRYPAPAVDAECTNGQLIVESNGIPGYEFQQITPNELAAQSHRWQIPVSPALPAVATDIPLLGTVAFTVTGLPVYGPNEGPVPADQAFGDPVYNGIMDECLGHTAQRGDYHFHAALVECIIGDPLQGEPSPILGYGLDGVPIYGPNGCLDEGCTQVVRFESSWEQISDPRSDAWSSYDYVHKDETQFLDRCNGRIGPDGTYRYHATDTFPYLLGCYGGADIVKDTPIVEPSVETNWIPVAAAAAGVGGSVWSTDLAVLNRTAGEATVEVLLHQAESTLSATTTVPADGQTVLSDVVAWITAGAGGVGSLEVRSDHRVSLRTRTFSRETDGRTFGQSLVGLDGDDGLDTGSRAYLLDLREDDEYRTNLGILNMGDTTATVSVTLRDGVGATLATFSLEVAPGQVAVENRILAERAGLTDIRNAWAEVSVTIGGGVWAYASVVDNRSQDPTTIAMTR